MFRNYILIAWRSLLKNRLFSIINIFGLALSMSVCMIVLVRLMDSLAYDDFHADQQQLYRIISKIENEEGKTWKLASTPLPLVAELRNGKSTEGLSSSTQFYPAIQQDASDGSLQFRVHGIFAEPSFFNIFAFTLKYGDNISALAKPRQVILSESTAKKFYGDLDPTGRTITLGTLGEFEVTGVLNIPPSKSHINYDVIASIATVPGLERTGRLPKQYDEWNSFEKGYAYVRLTDDRSTEAMKSRLDQITAEIAKTASSGSFRFELQPLSQITPSVSDIFNDIGRGPSRGSLMAEGGIVMIILIAACFNYTNLSLARALTRGKEVGIRKLSGAQRWQIFAQYTTEAVIIALMALIIANIILSFILEFKPFNDGYEMVPSVTPGAMLFLVFIVFAIFAGIMAGAPAAWMLSAFNPARILRGIGTEKIMGSLSLRKVLMVFQFSLSLVILIFLSTFYQQFNFIAEADPGFYRDKILLIPAGNNKEVTATTLSTHSGIKNTGFTSDAFGTSSLGAINISRQALEENRFLVEQYACDNNWLKMMRLELIAGTLFSSASDSSILINEKATAILGFKNATDAPGSIVYLQDSIKVIVKGVIKDFYSQGFGNPIRPILFRSIQPACKFIALETDQTSAAFVATVESEWKKQNPGHAFEYIWLKKQMEEQNDQSAQISLLGFLGFMTATIASLGLLGLVVYTVETRRKEISIRKIIGANVRQVITLLSGSFIQLLILSGVVALPIGYILSKLFLANFANQVAIGLWDVLLCFGLLLMIGLITILSQTWKASVENPARNLRSE